jgi:isopentenyldiphosphate isomerase
VLVGLYEGEVLPNEGEVHAYRWVDVNDLFAELTRSGDTYTPWFKTALDLLKRKDLLSSAAVREHLKGEDRL